MTQPSLTRFHRLCRLRIFSVVLLMLAGLLTGMPGLSDPPSLKSEVSAATGAIIPTVQLIKARSQILTFKQPLMRVSVAEPNTLDVIPLAPDQLLLNGKNRGSTSVIVWDNAGQEGIFTVQVLNDSSEIDDLIRQLSPNEKLQTRVTDDSFVVAGQGSSTVVLDEIRRLASAYGYKNENFIDITETPSPQVSLKVRVMEASREVVRKIQNSVGYYTPSFNVTRLGNPVDVNRLANGFKYLYGATNSTGSQISTSISNGIVPTLANTVYSTRQPLPYVVSSNNVGGITSSYTPSWNRNLQTAFDMLETTGKVKTLAEPSLLVAHGKTASFLAGGEVPFVSGTDRNGGPILSYKEYGVKLKFTPSVTQHADKLQMIIAPEVSTLDSSNCISSSSGSPVCGLLKRSTETTVELKNGETLMISGIISQNEQKQLQKIPIMGDLPIIGPLFRSSQTTKDERELVVVVTPTIIQDSSRLPIPPSDVALPPAPSIWSTLIHKPGKP